MLHHSSTEAETVKFHEDIPVSCVLDLDVHEETKIAFHSSLVVSDKV